MRSLQIDDEGNLIISKGSLSVVDGIKCLAQNIKTRLGLCLGENPFDLEEGIDYDNDVIGRLAGKQYYEQIIRNRILADSTDILGIRSINFSNNADIATVNVEIESAYGDIKL